MATTRQRLLVSGCLFLGGLALGCGSGDGSAAGADGTSGSGAGDGASSGGASDGTGTGTTGSGGSTSGGGSEANVQSVEGYGDPLGQTANAVAHFANGDIVVAGSFYGSVDFGSGAAATSNGQQDIFVARYTPEGTNLWTRPLGSASSSAHDHGYDVAVDPAGDVVVVGRSGSSVGWPTDWPDVSNDDSSVIAKLSGVNGAPIWGRLYNPYGEGIRGVAVDAQGDILATGLAETWFDMAGMQVAEVRKYSSDGELLWSRQMHECDAPSAGLAVAAHGSYAYVTGSFEGTCNFGGTPLSSAGGRDVFLAKYDGSGNHISSVAFGGSGQDHGFDLVVSELSGDVMLTGSFEGAVDFGGGVLDSAGLEDGFVVKLSADGAHLWSERFGGPVDDAGLGIATNGLENVYLTGYYQQVFDMGTGPLTSDGAGDILVAMLDPTGELQWVHSFGGRGWDEGASLSVDPNGSATNHSVTVVGSFQVNAAFGDSELSSAGSADAFVLQLGP